MEEKGGRSLEKEGGDAQRIMLPSGVEKAPPVSVRREGKEKASQCRNCTEWKKEEEERPKEDTGQK